jgi:hypothetical protein
MTILRLRFASIVTICMSITISPTMTAACGAHGSGHAAPKLLDKSSIPANAFRYVNKPTATENATAVAPSPSANATPTLQIRPPR